MIDLMTTLPWIGASVAVLATIVLGLGFALHFQSRIPFIAQPAIGALLAIIPPIGLLLVGRNLALKNLDFNVVIDPGGIAAWILRGTSAAIVGLSVAIVIVRLLDRDARLASKGRPLMLAFLVYFLTNVVLNAMFGTVPGTLVTYFYPLIVVFGLFMVRDQGYANLLIAIRWGLTLMMIASVALMPVMPNLVIQPNMPDARLPGITFRFFGLGSGPNSIGPLALTLILIAIHVPFRSRLLQLASLASATIVLVLAQSQTSWIAAAITVPSLLVYRWVTGESNGRPRTLSPALILGLVGLTAAAALTVSFFFVDWEAVFGTLAAFTGYGDGLDNRSFTGRGAIWVVAYETFLENPLFGYGVSAWNNAFRAKLNMPYAFHAHNQLMQALSVGGLLGALGLVSYVGVLGYYSLKFARFTRGLAPALLTLILVRCISEVPLDVMVLLAGDFITHLCLFSVLAASAAMVGRHAAAPAPARVQAWVAAPSGPGFAPARSVADEGDVDERALRAIVRLGASGRGTPAAPPPGPPAPTRPGDRPQHASPGPDRGHLPASLSSAPWPPPKDGRFPTGEQATGERIPPPLPSSPSSAGRGTPRPSGGAGPRVEPRFDDDD